MTTKGKRIKKFRSYLELNQTQFANELNITQQAVQRVESDNGNFNIETLEKLNTSFGLNINWFLTGNGSMFNKPKNTFEIKYEPITINQFDFGKRLNKVRVQSDMISAELAMLLDIRENRLLDIMNGKNEPTLEEVKKICENFNVTADWLIFGKE